MTWCEHLAKVLAPSALQLVGPRPHPTPPPPLAMARVMYWWGPLMQAALQATPLLPWSRRCNGKPVDIVDGAALAASSDAKRTQTKSSFQAAAEAAADGPYWSSLSLSANSWPLTGQLAAASDDADAFDAQFQVHRSQTCEKCTYSSNRQDWMVWPHCQAAAAGCNHSPCMPSSGG